MNKAYFEFLKAKASELDKGECQFALEATHYYFSYDDEYYPDYRLRTSSGTFENISFLHEPCSHIELIVYHLSEPDFISVFGDPKVNTITSGSSVLVSTQNLYSNHEQIYTLVESASIPELFYFKEDLSLTCTLEDDKLIPRSFEGTIHHIGATKWRNKHLN